MKLKYKFAIEKIGSKFIAVTVDEDAEKYRAAIKLNEYGMMLIQLLQTDVSKEDLKDRMQPFFNDAAALEVEIDKFIKVLDSQGLIV